MVAGKRIKERLELHKRKYVLMDEIDALLKSRGSKEAYKKIKELHTVVKKEQQVIKNLSRDMRLFSKIDPEFVHVAQHIAQIDESLRKQSMHLNLTRLYSVITARIRGRYESFKAECEIQNKENKKFLSFIKRKMKSIEEFGADMSQFETERDLFLQFIQGLHDLIKLTNDVHRFNKKALEVLGISKQLHKTRVYHYINEDIDKIEKQLKRVLEQPKKSKLASVLAGFYIISPGTFELTGIYLMLRYMRKYVTDKEGIVSKSYKGIKDILSK